MIYTLIIALSVIQAVLFLGHWFLYKSLTHLLAVTNPAAVLTLKISLTFLSISFILASVLIFRSSHILIRIFYTAAATWLGFFYFFLWAAVISWLGYGLAKVLNIDFDIKIFAEILLILAVVVGIYGIVNANIIRVARVNVRLPNLPTEWRGKTAAWVSDLHLGPVRGYSFVAKVAEKIAELKPDIIFIGGDFYDGQVVYLNKLIEPFNRLKAPLGKYFVAGNHEEFSDKTPYLQTIRDAGIKVLDNEQVEIGGIRLMGVDYFNARTEDKFREILKKFAIEKNKPSILLAHSPYYFKVSEEEGIDLQLSGHTHAGQMFPANILTHFIFRGYDYGLKKFKNLTVYTSSGVGTWGIPMRFGSVSEVVVVKFE